MDLQEGKIDGTATNTNNGEVRRIAVDRKLLVGVLFVYFNKAFDIVLHNILLRKLNDLGIRGDIWLWLSSYFTERRQFVRVYGIRHSTYRTVHPRAQFWDPPYSPSSQTTSQSQYVQQKLTCTQTTQRDAINALTNKLNNVLADLNLKNGATTIYWSHIRTSARQWLCSGNPSLDQYRLCVVFIQKLYCHRSRTVPAVWGSCNKTHFSNLEKLHARAGRIMYGLPWDTSTANVLMQINKYDGIVLKKCTRYD